MTGGLSSAALFLGIGIGLTGGESVDNPSFAGFELEDGIYLIGPVSWLGWLMPFLTVAGIGAAVYCLWTLGRLIRAYRAKPTPAGVAAPRPITD